MAIVKWAPFSAFTSLEREMQSMLDRFGAPALTGWKPACDIVRNSEELLITIELPGMSPEDVSVEFEDGMLHITGEKNESRIVEDKDRYVSERRYGSFRRDMVLPEGVLADDIDAEFDNGVLTVSVPVPPMLAEEEQPRTIKIDVNRPAKLET